MEGVDRTGGTAADEARVREAAETRRTAKAAEASGPARPSTVPSPASAATEGVPAVAVRDAQEAAAAERARELAAASARQGDVPAAEPKPERKRGVAAVFAGLLLAMFVSTLSETVTATALPTIVGDLGGVDHMQWVTTAYILASTIMMPIYGKLGDLFGRKYLFIVALSVFIVGSATCGLAPSMDGLIAGRAVEGLGGGGLIILAQATIADIIPPRQRGKYMGVMGSVFAVSTVVGPLLGGWFVQVTGWRWLFAFNIPLALLAIAAVAFFLTNPERRDDRPPVDVGGMMAMAVSVSSLVLATAWGGTLYPWLSWQILGLFALFLVVAVVFVLVERRAKEPIIPMLLFKNRNFVVCTVTGMFIMLGMMGTVSYLPTYFQIVDRPRARAGRPHDVPRGGRRAAHGRGHGLLRHQDRALQVDAHRVVRRGGRGVRAAVAPDAGHVAADDGRVPVRAGLRHRPRAADTRAHRAERVPARHRGHGHGGQQLLPADRLNAGRVACGRAVHLAPRVGSGCAAAACGQHQHEPHHAPVRRPPRRPVRDIITAAYSDALVPIFLYVVPLLVVGFILMLTLKENPLAKSVNHTGHPGDDAL